MAGRAGIWLTAKKLHIGLDKTSPIYYNKGIKGKGNKKMKFTEEQIKAILECIDNTNIELFRSEWEEIEESLRKGN